MNARDYVMKTAEEKMVKHGGFGIDSLASAAKAVGSIAPLLNAGIVGGYASGSLLPDCRTTLAARPLSKIFPPMIRC